MPLVIEYNKSSALHGSAFWYRSNINDSFKADQVSYITLSQHLLKHLIAVVASRPDYAYRHYYRIRDTLNNAIWIAVTPDKLREYVIDYKTRKHSPIQIGI
jgi:hypothetical protein